MGTVNIAFGYVGGVFHRNHDTPLFDEIDVENLTTNASTATPSVNSPPRPQGSRDIAVRIVADEDVYVRTDGTTVTTSNGMLVKANTETFFHGRPGQVISVIDAA